MAPLSAAQSRAADSTSVLSTVCRSNLDRLMSLSTSAVALCCSSKSSSSRRSRTTSVSWPEADELLWRTAFGAFALRLRALVGLLLARERRRIAHPKGLGLRRFSRSITAGICDRRNGVNDQFALPELDYDRSYSKRV